LNDIEKTVDCSLDCLEGKAYRVGKITLVGDESIDRSKFIRRLLLSEGGIFNPENLVLSVQFLNQAGLYKPLSNSDIELKIDDALGTVDLTFRLLAPKQ
jgi:outer membrane protein assembly factor BamA